MSENDEVRLRQRLDRADISDVQLRYCTSIDTLNWELFRTCFTDEVKIDFSASGLPLVHVTAEVWVENTESVLGVLKATQHVIANHVITLDDDDHATCVAGVRARHHNPNSTGDSEQTVYGYYTNQFERTSSGWRMAVLKLTPTWSSGNIGVMAGLAEGATWCGLRLKDGTWQSA